MARPMGRPTKYKQSVVRGICLRLMTGQSLNEICRLDQYPHKQTVLNWLHKYPDFFDQYRRAREIQQEHHLDEMLEIADDSTNDYMIRQSQNGDEYEQFNSEHVQRSKLRIDTRKWIMERMAPKQYGSKNAIDHTSSDGSMSNKPSIIQLVAPSDDSAD